MKLTLKQKGCRPFQVLFNKNNVHTFHLPNDPDLAWEKIDRILDETVPTQNPQDFFDGMVEAVSSLAHGHRNNCPTSFYCGAVCLTLER